MNNQNIFFKFALFNFLIIYIMYNINYGKLLLTQLKTNQAIFSICAIGHKTLLLRLNKKYLNEY